MARAIWSGSIGFGMVNIPVKLFGATAGKDISFNLADALRRSVEAAKRGKSKRAARQRSRPAARPASRKAS